MKNMTKANRAEIKAWLESVHDRAERYADLLDPKRKCDAPLVNKIDSLGRMATTALFEFRAE